VSYIVLNVSNNVPDVVGFEVLTAVSTKTAVFWVVAPTHRPDDGGSKDL
jgi:hypothetical protein